MRNSVDARRIKGRKRLTHWGLTQTLKGMRREKKGHTSPEERILSLSCLKKPKQIHSWPLNAPSAVLREREGRRWGFCLIRGHARLLNLRRAKQETGGTMKVGFDALAGSSRALYGLGGGGHLWTPDLSGIASTQAYLCTEPFPSTALLHTSYWPCCCQVWKALPWPRAGC